MGSHKEVAVKSIVTLCVLLVFAGSAGAETIFNDNFDDTSTATQADLVSAVDTGTWIEVFIDTATINTSATKFFNFGRGDYDYTAVFTKYGSVAGGGTCRLDICYGDAVHDYNTITFIEGTTELCRIEVQTNDGDTGNTDAQINLVGATTENITDGIREGSPANRTFEFTFDATGVDLSITGDGLGAPLTASVDYANTPTFGPDRIRVFKNDFFGNSDRGQLRVDDMDADFTSPTARNILIDFDDGNANNGIHDTAVLDGDFSGQPSGTSINPPWQSLAGGPEFLDTLPPGIGGARNLVMVLGRVYAVDTGHVLGQGDIFNLEFFWRDAWQWDPPDTVEMVLYYTDTDAIDGTATAVYTLNSGGRSSTVIWEGEYGTSPPYSGGGVGKKLFVKLQSTVDAASEFARMDNIFLEVIRGQANFTLFLFY
jgi:hypothetical protein